ncbi:MAG: alpha-L-arabinofuranosidase C-terminal domain-containing protein [bacterium]
MISPVRKNCAFSMVMLLVAAAPGCGGDSPGPEAPPPATVEASIAVDAGDVLGAVHPHVYGHFIENLGQCIYGGIWQDKPQVPTVHGGIRVDVLEMLRPIRPSVLRWPGGCFSDGYHWTDGIGPLRPVRVNRAWWLLNLLDPRIAPLDPNTFGTDEFIAFVRELGAEPYLAVNFGTGTPEEAAAWVAYCNADISDTTSIGVDARGVDWRDAEHWARERLAHTGSGPYGVRYWGIGNEIYSWFELGGTDSVSYAQRLIEYHDRMKAIDPEIKLVAVGYDEDWNEDVLQIAGDSIEYLSVHAYYPDPFESIGRGVVDSEPDYYSLLASPGVLEGKLEDVGGTIARVLGSNDRVKIALDEWNLWWDFRQLIHTEYSLRAGLFAASVLAVLQRQAGVLGMASLSEMVNTIGMINTSETDLFATPIYHAFKLYRDHALGLIVASRVESETFESEPLGNIPAATGVPYLECAATRDEAGNTVSLIVVNRHYDHAIRTSVEVRGLAPKMELSAWELNGPDPHARNDFDHKDRVGITKLESRRVSPVFQYTFPPHSVTAMVLLGR